MKRWRTAINLTTSEPNQIEIEIKDVCKLDNFAKCEVKDCEKRADEVIVGFVQNSYGTGYNLCSDHNDVGLEFFELFEVIQ